MTRKPLSVLVVDDEPIARSVLEDELNAAGYVAVAAENPLAIPEEVDRGSFDVVLTDLRMPGQDGLTFLRELKAERSEQAVIVMTAFGTVDTAVQAIKLGAFDYITKDEETKDRLLFAMSIYSELRRANLAEQGLYLVNVFFL